MKYLKTFEALTNAALANCSKTRLDNCDLYTCANNVKVEIYDSGTIKWYKNNNLHREDGPAVEYPNGSFSWYKNGVLHNIKGPAIYINNKSMYQSSEKTEYWINGIEYEYEEWKNLKDK